MQQLKHIKYYIKLCFNLKAFTYRILKPGSTLIVKKLNGKAWIKTSTVYVTLENEKST